jgi:hypothetical protein
VSFAQGELPPILQKILDVIEANDGKMTTEEFRQMFIGSPMHTLRITNDDIDELIKFLKKKGFVVVNHEYQKETIKFIKPFFE